MIKREIIVLVFLFAGNLNCLEQNANSNKLDDSDWQCSSVCVGSGGNAEYDRKNHICKCRMDENVLDGIDLEIMIKNARNMGMLLESIENEEGSIKKRSTDSTSDSILGDRPAGTRSRSSSLNSATIRRSSLTTRRPTTTRTTRRSLTTTRRSLTTSRASPRRQSSSQNLSKDAQKRIEDIQKRFNKRMQNRARTSSLPRLQQRADFDDSPKPNILEQIRERQKELMEKLKSRSSIDSRGRSAGDNTNHDSTRTREHPTVRQEAPKTSGKSNVSSNDNTNSDIITQPPNLYSKDDN